MTQSHVARGATPRLRIATTRSARTARTYSDQPRHPHHPATAGHDAREPDPLGRPGNAGNGWAVTVTAVYPDATAQVLAANEFNDPPAPGRQFFMIAVNATYSGPTSSRLNSSFAMRAVGASQVVYTTFDEQDCGVLPEPNLWLADPEVFTGGMVSGNAACWSVLSSDAGSLGDVLRRTNLP